MDYNLCIICQKSTTATLRCPSLDSRTPGSTEAYQAFLDDWERFRNADVSVNISLPLSDATVNNLLIKEVKWHKNCRREIREDKFLRKQKLQNDTSKINETAADQIQTLTTSSRRTSTRTGAIPKVSDTCLFCNKPGEGRNTLHSFQKVELTEELRKKAILVQDDNVLPQLSVGDVVANELKYHRNCYLLFNRKFTKSETKAEDVSPERSKILEEILGLIEEDLAAGRLYFTLKSLYEELHRKAQLADIPTMNRTMFKMAVLERFHPILKEEKGFRNEVVLVCSTAMKDLVQSSLVEKDPSEDYRILSKAAIIIRRDMAKSSFNFLKDGFHAHCQKDSIASSLKYIIGLIMYGPSHEVDFEKEQATLSIAQLIYFNSHMRKRFETPLPTYLGLLVHSKFRDAFLVEELHRLGLSINYNRVKYIELKLGDAVVQNCYSEQLVCPTEMRIGLFTVGAVDNIDHNPSARTAKGSFHGTAISLFQARQHEDDGDKRVFTIQPKAPGKLKLPDDFTTLPQLVNANLKTVPRILEIETLDKDVGLILRENSKEEEWARSVHSQIDQYPELEDSDVKSTWSSFHARDQQEMVPCISGLFPLFKESSNNPKMILHAMELIKKSVQYCNSNQIPVVAGDQPIYAIMKKLQWTHESVKDVVVMLGGFHTEKHIIKAIGDILRGSGWTEALVKAGVASSGTADGIQNAVHVTKARLHM